MAQLSPQALTFNEGHALIFGSIALALLGGYATLFSAFLPLSGIFVSPLSQFYLLYESFSYLTFWPPFLILRPLGIRCFS